MNTQKMVTLVTAAMGMFGCLIAAPASASCGVHEMDFSNGSALAVVSSKASGMADVAAALQLTDRLQSLVQASQVCGNSPFCPWAIAPTRFLMARSSMPASRPGTATAPKS